MCSASMAVPLRIMRTEPGHLPEAPPWAREEGDRPLPTPSEALPSLLPAAAVSASAPPPPSGFDAVLEAVIELLGSSSLAASFLPVCRQWFNEAVCHPGSFREPVEAWRAGACRQLDEQLVRMREPPAGDEDIELRVGLEHAEEELRLTEISGGVTVILLRYTRRLSGLLHWLTADMVDQVGDSACASLRRRYLRHEALEFRRRVGLLALAMVELRGRLPDPEMPVRWAEWFEEAGEVAGLPRSHCARYRSQREQVAAVWANNQRTFLSTDEHVDALEKSLGELDDLVENLDGHAENCDEARRKFGWTALGCLREQPQEAPLREGPP